MTSEPRVNWPAEQILEKLDGLKEDLKEDLTEVKTELRGPRGTTGGGLSGKVEQIRLSQESLEKVVGKHETRLDLVDQRCESRHAENPGNKHRWGLWALGSGIGAGIIGAIWALWEKVSK